MEMVEYIIILQFKVLKTPLHWSTSSLMIQCLNLRPARVYVCVCECAVLNMQNSIHSWNRELRENQQNKQWERSRVLSTYRAIWIKSNKTKYSQPNKSAFELNLYWEYKIVPTYTYANVRCCESKTNCWHGADKAGRTHKTPCGMK